jgi:ParB/RepB/Spo0J family partition protein
MARVKTTRRVEQTEAQLTALHPNTWNPNAMNDREYQAALESIRHYGFIDPITVRPHPERPGEFEIIDGEHRWQAAAESGVTEVPLIVLHGIGDTDAKKLTIILNETRGTSQTVDLARLLRELGETMDLDVLNLGLPYSPNELEDLIRLADFNWEDHDGARARPSGEFVRFVVAMPEDAYEVLTQARNKVEARLTADGYILHNDGAVANGQIVEALAAEYLAGQ